MNTTIDTTTIRAEWEPRKRSAIYGVEFENGDAKTVLAMCDEIDALRASVAGAEAERDELRERMEPEYRAMAQEIDALRAKLAEAKCERDELGDDVELFAAVMADMVNGDADCDAATGE